MNYQGTYRFCKLENQVIPGEGPKAIPLVLDFNAAAGQPILVDLLLTEQQGRFSMLQTIYVDASQSANDISITADITGQVIVAKSKTQGYYNILAPNPCKLSFQSLNGGLNNVTVMLLNIPIAGVVWAVS